MGALELTEPVLERLSTPRNQEEFYDSSFNAGASFGVRVGKGGRKSFFLIYSLNNKRVRMTLGIHPTLSLADARSEAIELLRRVRSGRDPARERREYRVSPTMEELVSRFMSENQSKGRKRTTAKEYQRIFDAEVLPRWSAMKARDVTESAIRDLLEEIRGERGSPIMAERARSLLSSLYRFGVNARLLSANPVEQIAAVTKPRPRERILTNIELQRLWYSLQAEDPIIRGAFRLLILTGQRASSVLELRWQEIVFEQWSLPGSPRTTVFLHPLALETLRELRGLNESSDTVFGDGNLLAALRRAAVRLNRETQSAEPWTAQDIRRTVEYGMRDLRIRPDVIERALSRRTLPVRLKRRLAEYDYAHDLKQAFLQWGRKIALLVSSEPPPHLRSKVVKLFP